MIRTGSPDTRGIEHGTSGDLELGAGGEILCQNGLHRPVGRIGPEPGRTDPGDDRRAVGDGGPSDREGVASIVLDPIVIDEPPTKAIVAKGRGKLQRRGARQALMPAAVMAGAEDVIQRQTSVEERLGREWDAVDRKQQRLETDEVRGDVEQPRTFGQRLAHQTEAKLFEIAQSAVDESRRTGRRARCDVVLLDEDRAHPSRHGVQQRPATDDPAPDDHHVPSLGAQGFEGGPSGIDGRLDRLRLCHPLLAQRGSSGRWREILHSSQPVPTMRTTIASGVWKTSDCSEVGRMLVRTAAPRTTATTARATSATSRQPG